MSASRVSLQHWDSQTQLTAEQLGLCSELAAMLGGHTSTEIAQTHPTTTSAEDSPDSPSTSLSTSVETADTALQLGALSVQEGLSAEFVAYHTTIAEYETLFRTLNQLVSGIDAKAALLSTHYHTVNNDTNAVREECEGLLQEQQDLIVSANRLRFNLTNFEKTEQVATLLATRLNLQNVRADDETVAVLSDDFVEALEKLESALTYMEENPTFSDAAKFTMTLQRLRLRVTRAVKNYFEMTLAKCTTAINKHKEELRKQYQALKAESLTTASATTPVPAAAAAAATGVDGKTLEASVPVVDVDMDFDQDESLFTGHSVGAFLELRGVAASIGPLIRDIESRAIHQPLYRTLLQECQQNYFHHRQVVLASGVQGYFTFLAHKSDANTLVRSAYSYLFEVCTMECKAFHVFFAKSDQSTEILRDLCGFLCGLLYHTVRPKVIREDSIETLFGLAFILKYEVLEGQIGAIDPQEVLCVDVLAHTVEMLLQDVQEKLSYRAQIYIRDEISHYVTSQEDVAYPAKLEQKQQERKATAAEQASEEDDIASVLDQSIDVTDETELNLRDYYPPLVQTLSLLNKLYKTVEVPVFQYIANEAVKACMSALTVAGALVYQNLQHELVLEEKEAIPGAGPAVHRALFLARHLVALRQGLRSFHVELVVTEQSYDLPQHIKAIFLKLWAMTVRSKNPKPTDNGKTLVTWDQIFPQMHETMTDSRKDLETTLTDAVRVLVAAHTQYLGADIQAFLDQHGSSLLKYSTVQAYLTQQWTGTTDNDTILAVKLHTVQHLYHMYLSSKATERMFLKPTREALVLGLNRLETTFEQTTFDTADTPELTPDQAKESILSLLYTVKQTLHTES